MLTKTASKLKLDGCLDMKSLQTRGQSTSVERPSATEAQNQWSYQNAFDNQKQFPIKIFLQNSSRVTVFTLLLFSASCHFQN